MKVKIITYVPSTQRQPLRSLNRWLVLACISLSSINVNAEMASAQSSDIEIGRRIYMEGILPSGKPLKGKRMNEMQVEGPTAACESCHRRSGMGSLEGNIVVPPITGRFLFDTNENRPMALVDAREARNVTRPREPYNEATLAKAIREGVNVSNKAMNPLMPQYDLTAAEIKAVIAYLRQLSSEVSPGVGEDSVHFATVVTPDVSPQQRDALVDMIQTAFKQRNNSQQNYSGRMRMPLDLLPRTTRNWHLTVWELKGKHDTWGEQLAEYYRSQPVFAVISGVSNGTWEPIDAFCEQEKIPCMLPSIALTPTKTSFYSLYYSRGVALEADVLAKYLRTLGKDAPKQLVQIHKDDAVGRGAAQALSDALASNGIKVENRVIGDDATAAKQALARLSSEDAVMLWLRPNDLNALSKIMPKAPTSSVFVSGFLADEHYDFVAKDWQKVRVIYPYDLNKEVKVAYASELDKGRGQNTATMKAWLNAWKLPLVDEMMQTEVFFDLLFLTDLSSQMLDNLHRDYFVERAEDMLSYGSNSSAYPDLSLARGQRFASKGAYIAHFSQEGKLVADSEWLVP